MIPSYSALQKASENHHCIGMKRPCLAAAAAIFICHLASADALSSSSSSSPLPDELRRALRSSPPSPSSPGNTAKGNSDPLASSSSEISVFNLLSSADRSRSADAPDEFFYSYPMLVQHNDDVFRRKLSALYSEVLPSGGGGTFLDLGSSWVSHLPNEPCPTHVWLHGMNREELERNPAGNGWKIVKSFNDLDDEINKKLLSLSGDSSSENVGDNSITASTMLLPEIPDNCVDVVGICAAFQYWRFPERVVGEILRVLKPGGSCVVSFSNRMFASKAVGVWSSRTADRDRLRYVCDMLTRGARTTEPMSSNGESKTTYGLKVERSILDGSRMAVISAPISMMLGYQPFGDPFLAVVANKQPTSSR